MFHFRPTEISIIDFSIYEVKLLHYRIKMHYKPMNINMVKPRLSFWLII